MTAPAAALHAAISARIGRTSFGAEATAHALVVALIARGHVLLQGYPGLGKTLLARTFARSLGGRFERVQCTPDLMPADLTGVHLYDAPSNRFVLRAGPLFGDVVLVDEINRTGPKTQSAMLQAMEERMIALDREQYPLSLNFMIIATQNPHEFEGTYPLPESQLDRFLMLIDVRYPTAEAEREVLRAYDKPANQYTEQLEAVDAIDTSLLAQARAQAGTVLIADQVYDYAQAIAAATRAHPQVTLGLSTRGLLSLVRSARAEAAIHDREFMTPDDLKGVAGLVVPHRLVLAPDATLEGIGPNDVLTELLGRIPVPRE